MGSGAPTEGELWTREQLAALLARRFHPSAIASFLAESQRRANRVRRERPALARREASFVAAGAAGWGGLALLGVEPFRRRRRSGMLGWAATAVMLDWHLGMFETEDGRPRNLGRADAATLLRAWLAPAVADRAAPALCAIGLATDALDGPLARAAEPTRFGRDLEGLADAAFAGAALRGARRQGLVPAPVAWLELGRMGIGIAYAVAVYFGRAEPPGRELLRAGRASAPLRAAGLIAAGAGRRRTATALLLAGSGAGGAAAAGGLFPTLSGQRPLFRVKRLRAAF